MKIYYQNSELHVAKSDWIKLSKLEMLTGSDFLLSERDINDDNILPLHEFDVIVQRKSNGDFISSIDKIEEICFRMASVCKKSVLLIDGIFTSSKNSMILNNGMRHDYPFLYLQSKILQAQIMGVFVYFIDKTSYIEAALENIYKMISLQSDILIYEKKIGARLAGILNTISTYPGIGKIKAEILVDKLGSLDNVNKFLLDETKDITINGIAKKTKAKFRDYYNNIKEV